MDLGKEGKPERDSLGRIKYRAVTDEESETRRNYQKGDVINYLDGDSLIAGISLWLRKNYSDQR